MERTSRVYPLDRLALESEEYHVLYVNSLGGACCWDALLIWGI